MAIKKWDAAIVVEPCDNKARLVAKVVFEPKEDGPIYLSHQVDPVLDAAREVVETEPKYYPSPDCVRADIKALAAALKEVDGATD